MHERQQVAAARVERGGGAGIEGTGRGGGGEEGGEEVEQEELGGEEDDFGG